MLKIHAEQMQVFEAVALQRFEDEMVRHVKKFAPRHSEIIGDQGVREVVKLGIERAPRYAFTTRGPVRFYIELMVMFGSSFDTDPQLPGFSEILNQGTIGDQLGRAEKLHDRTLDYLQHVAGPNNAYTLSALRNIHARASEPVVFSREGFEGELLSEMKRLYPEKCAYAGDSAHQTLIQEGIALAKAHSVSSTRGIALFPVLMFALGHGFASDPLFPWAVRTLMDPRVKESEKRAQRLEAKALTYLGGVLDYFGQR